PLPNPPAAPVIIAVLLISIFLLIYHLPFKHGGSNKIGKCQMLFIYLSKSCCFYALLNTTSKY
ncbi:MAG: hypothetical protein E7B04_08775, partial [Staphylococcus epidermidis]|nr:hypothetical protein [Staphylococcus epidermidis]